MRTGYSAIADKWIGITPGTDGLLVLSLVHLLLTAGKIDLDYLLRYTNAAWLVDQDPALAGFGLLPARRDRAASWSGTRPRKRAVPAEDGGQARTLRPLQRRADPREAGVRSCSPRPTSTPPSPRGGRRRPAASPPDVIRRLAAELAASPSTGDHARAALDRLRGERHER